MSSIAPQTSTSGAPQIGASPTSDAIPQTLACGATIYETPSAGGSLSGEAAVTCQENGISCMGTVGVAGTQSATSGGVLNVTAQGTLGCTGLGQACTAKATLSGTLVNIGSATGTETASIAGNAVLSCGSQMSGGAGGSCTLSPSSPPASVPTGIPYLLPTNFQVYVSGNSVINQPAAGFSETTLPTVNQYMGSDGGYMAVYTNDPAGCAYALGNNLYVDGQIRLEGSYQGRVFQPTGYTTQALTALGNQYFPGRNGGTWLGGDTGGWFGIP